MSRRKGAKGENEVRDLLRLYGWEGAHRNLQSGGQGGGDLVDAIDGWHIEVKRVERLDLAAAWRQADRAKRPTESIVVAHRRNGWPVWLGTVLLTDLMGVGALFPWSPLAVGPRTDLGAAFWERSRHHTHPLVVKDVAGECVATVALPDLLNVIAMACAGI
jgi:hypothetical protein